LKMQGQPGSRNQMKEELLRKSSMFRRDMKKLNMMKEVKSLLENRDRIAQTPIQKEEQVNEEAKEKQQYGC